jgi:RNA polymerase sigma-70 factor (ECF subfamily)
MVLFASRNAHCKGRNLRQRKGGSFERRVKPVMTTAEGARVPDRTEALERLMQEYGTKIMHLAYYYLKDRHLAEDVAQEVFVKAYRNWDSFRGDSSAYTWLYKITVNLCRDKTRSAWWKRLIPTDDPRGAAVTPLETVGQLQEGPEEAALRGDQREALLTYVMALPDAYREVVLLYYYQDLSAVEIAQITEQNENTIKTRLFRARAMLKSALMKGGETGE